MSSTKVDFAEEILRVPGIELSPDPTPAITMGLLHVISKVTFGDTDNLGERMITLINEFVEGTKGDKKFQQPIPLPVMTGALTMSVFVHKIPARFVAFYSAVDQVTFLTLDTFILE